MLRHNFEPVGDTNIVFSIGEGAGCTISMPVRLAQLDIHLTSGPHLSELEGILTIVSADTNRGKSLNSDGYIGRIGIYPHGSQGFDIAVSVPEQEFQNIFQLSVSKTPIKWFAIDSSKAEEHILDSKVWNLKKRHWVHLEACDIHY
jgi:hypothetical protein